MNWSLNQKDRKIFKNLQLRPCTYALYKPLLFPSIYSLNYHNIIPAQILFLHCYILKPFLIYLLIYIMTEEQSKTKQNPQISATNEKIQLKRVDQEVNTMKNRVQLLRQQLNKQKQSIKKHKNLMKEAIEKKIQVNRINQFKQKDNSDEVKKIQQLRTRNKQIKQTHQRDLENIQKAIYLVKLDDARELKNISMEHRRRIKDMQREFLSAQQQKKKRIAQESEKAKERYMIYWRQKLQDIYTEQAQTLVQTMSKKEEKKKQLKSLQEEEIKLLEEINKVHSQEVQSKKQYLAALSIPVKDVAEAMGENLPIRASMVNSSLQVSSNSRYRDQGSQRRSIDASGLRLPNASVNQAKLKIILSQLKKVDRQKSARN